MSIAGMGGHYPRNKDNNSNSGNNPTDEPILRESYLSSSNNTSNQILKRSLHDTRPQQDAKRQKTTTTTENVTNKHLCSNTIDSSSSISLSQKSVRIENEQIPKEILEKSPLNGISEHKIATATENETNQESKVLQIKSDYRKFISCFRYYQDAFEAEIGNILHDIDRVNVNEAQFVLGSIEGDAWWIRRKISSQDIFEGLVYSNGKIEYHQLPTDSDLVEFFSKKNPTLHLEALRKERVDRIKNSYREFSSSVGYYQDVLQLGILKTPDMVNTRDIFEAQDVLCAIQGSTWWIRKSIVDGQELFEGLIYSNGKIQYCQLSTDNSLIEFFNKKNLNLHLEMLRREKLDRVNKIKNDYVIYASCFRYYRNAFQAELNNMPYEVARIDTNEVQTILGGINGNAWWIRRNLSSIEGTYVGIVYSDGRFYGTPLSTDNDLIQFFSEKNPALHLETLRKRKLDMIKIQSMQCFFAEYTRDVLQAGSRGAIIGEVAKIDSSKVHAILGAIEGNAWWIRGNIYGTPNAYQGVIYSYNRLDYFDLVTDDDLLQFSTGKNPALHLETLRKRALEKRVKIKEYLMPHSSSTYYRSVYEMESQGLDKEAFQLDLSEARAVLGNARGTVWWVRESVLCGKNAYRGLLCINGRDFYTWLFLTEDGVMEFCDRNEPLCHLEKLRKRQHFGPLKDLPKQLYDLLDGEYTLENNIDEKYNVLRKVVRSWLFLVHPDKIGKQLDCEIKASFQEKTGFYIDDETLSLIKNGDIIKILNSFQEKNK